MIMRFAGAIVGAIIITTGLFFLMQQLIASGKYEQEEDIGINLTSVRMEEEEQEIRRKERNLPERQQVKPPPPPMMTSVNMNNNTNLGGVQMEFDTGMNADLSFDGVSASLDRGSYPKFRVQPGWPRRAQERGISGCVEFGFTITKTGATKDIFIIDSSNSMFDRYGTRAIEKFKYEALVINGEARDDPGQSIRLVWQLEGERLPEHPACYD